MHYDKHEHRTCHREDQFQGQTDHNYEHLLREVYGYSELYAPRVRTHGLQFNCPQQSVMPSLQIVFDLDWHRPPFIFAVPYPWSMPPQPFEPFFPQQSEQFAWQPFSPFRAPEQNFRHHRVPSQIDMYRHPYLNGQENCPKYSNTPEQRVTVPHHIDDLHQHQPKLNPQPFQDTLKTERGTGQLPAECRAITGPVPQDAAIEAQKLLSGDWGTITPFTCGGVKYVARVEEHGPDCLRPYKHKGVTLYLDERTASEVPPPKIATENRALQTQGDHFPPTCPKNKLESGSEFLGDKLHVGKSQDPHERGLLGDARQVAIAREWAQGNIPEFMRPEHFKTIVLKDDQGNELKVKVMTRPAAVGNNSDSITAPINTELTYAACQAFNMGVPTRKLAEAMYKQADRRLPAQGLVSNASDSLYMDGNGFYALHDKNTKERLKDVPDSALVVGPWKYYTLSKYADPTNYPKMSKRLFQFGFWDSNGCPIQQGIFHGGDKNGRNKSCRDEDTIQNLKHGREHQDYSLAWQGVSQDVVLNGKPARYDDVLKDPRYAHLLSDEGPFDPAPIYRNTNPAYAQILTAQSKLHQVSKSDRVS
ncbi:MAG TPA: hypothetical protein V6C97_09990 [Oculatellaceae cyanobacterium]